MARFNLPDIEFVDVEVGDFEELAVSKFEELMPGVKLSEADPRRKLLQSVAYVAALLANNIDYTGKQNRLAYAEDEFLDHIGEEKGVSRLEPKPATVKLQFTVNNTIDYIIPEGTEVTNGQVTFATTESRLVTAGQPNVIVDSVCTEDGVIGNGIEIGALNTVTNPIPWVSRVENIETTSGGYDWESNEDFAKRIYLSPEGYSTAGPELAYIYHAKSAHQGIIDIRVLNPSDAVVAIYPLMQNGEIASQDVKNLILEACNAKNVRPLTDLVMVEDPEIIPYDLSITYHLPEYARSRASEYHTNITSAVESYKVWQKSRLGRGIDPGELYAKILQQDARRVSVVPNSFTALEQNQIARDRNVEVVFGGFVDE